MTFATVGRALGAAAGVLVLGGCALLLRHAPPEELGALDEDKRAQLQPLAVERAAAATEWRLVSRQVEIATAELDAAEAKEDVAPELGDWADDELAAARLRMLDDREAALAYCRARYTAMAELHQSEILAAEAMLDAAEAREDEAARRFNLAVAVEERARLAAVMDRPGVAREDRDKHVGRWDKRVQKLDRKATSAMVERRQAEIRAADRRKAWLGNAFAFRERFEDPCRVDWRLPEPGTSIEIPAAPVKNPPADHGPLLDEAPATMQAVPATAATAETAPAGPTVPATMTAPTALSAATAATAPAPATEATP